MEDISPRSRRDLEFHERHGEISTISARSRQSRPVLGNLGEMEHISPRSRRDLESNKNHGEISSISTRSRRSRRDLANLGEISVKILHGLRHNKFIIDSPDVTGGVAVVMVGIGAPNKEKYNHAHCRKKKRIINCITMQS